MTNAEHLAMAEYYVGIFDNTWKAMLTNPKVMGPTTTVDAMVNDNLLHAAEVHLKLAEAQTIVTVSDG